MEKIHYDQSYQTTADFLKWVAGKYDKDLVSQLNAAARDGSYNEDFWKKNTGRTVQELGAEWKASYAEKLGVTLPKDGSSGSWGSAVYSISQIQRGEESSLRKRILAGRKFWMVSAFVMLWRLGFPVTKVPPPASAMGSRS